jgi:hypothetical protein
MKKNGIEFVNNNRQTDTPKMNKAFLYVCVVLLEIFSSFTVIAQQDTTKKSRIELSLRYSLQCPIYSVNTPADLILSQDTRYRSRFSLGIRYYLLRRWYIEYSPAFSQEGGGYKEQKTNANYFKNSIFFGYSALHSRKIIFNVFCGIETNLLLNARLINIHTNERTNVSDYYNRFNLSYPIGFGIKTKIFKDYLFNFHTFLSFSPYKISNEPYINVSQIVFPAFQFGISKFLK